jgi:hypothetical protein
MDSQLDDDMDQPQKDYFVAIAQSMPENSNIILCGPEPGWLYTRAAGNGSLKIMDYLAWVALQHCKGVRIPLVISGDTHHYSRYEGNDGMTQFVTSGGGGAFLHPTHQLAETIDVYRPEDGITWMKHKVQKLTLGSWKTPEGVTQEACYPSRAESMAMLRGNLKFPSYNPSFGVVLGAIYWIIGLIGSHFPADIWCIAPLVMAGGFYAYTKRTEGNSAKVKAVSLVNGLVHGLASIALGIAFKYLNALILDAGDWPRLYFVLFAAEMIGLGGLIAAELFGIYLYFSSGFLDLNHNDAFSSMRRDSHRNFIRIRMTDDGLTLYPIGLTKVPDRDAWVKNDKPGSVYVAKPDLDPQPIEPAIVIKVPPQPTPTFVA